MNYFLVNAVNDRKGFWQSFIYNKSPVTLDCDSCTSSVYVLEISDIQFPIDTLGYSWAMSTNIEVTTRFKCIIEILDEQNKHDIYR